MEVLFSSLLVLIKTLSVANFIMGSFIRFFFRRHHNNINNNTTREYTNIINTANK